MKLILLLIIASLIPFIMSVHDVDGQVNYIRNIIKMEGTITGGVQNFDFILPESVTDQNKTMIFMSFRHIGDSNEKEVYRSWDFVNNTAIRFFGSNNTPANNDALSFVGYIVEFSENSDMFSQRDSLTIAGGLSDQEFTDQFSTSVNTTSSFFQYFGQTANHADLSWGQEEFAKMRIINSTFFGYEPFDAPNSGDTIVRYQIIDMNDPNVLVQRGSTTMPEGTALTTFSPPTAINGSRTMLFASHNLNNALDAESDEGSFTARINPSNQIEFDRDDAVCGGTGLCQLEISWETITFLDGSVYVQYLQFDDTTATGANVQQTGTVNFASTPVNATNSIAIGTVHTPLGLGQGRSAGGATGAWDREAYTIELIDADTVEVVINDGQELSDVWFQVVEFFNLEGINFNQTTTDTATVTDNVDLTINKTAVDFSSVVDMETNMTVTLENSDSVVVIDNVDLLRIILTDVADNGTVTDVTEFNINKTLIDTALISDTVSLSTIRNILLSDIVTANDPSIILKVNSVIPPDSGAPASSGGEIPKGIPTFQRIVGLSITSEYFNIVPRDVVPSDFIIQTFGKDESGVAIKSIEPDQQFKDWFAFSKFPDPLTFETSVDNSRLINDPARYKNIALDDFTLNAPSISCNELDPFVTPIPCLDPIIYKVPLTFTFTKGGVEFKEKHIVTVDATLREVQCDLFCIVNDYLQENYWWIAGAIIVVMMMYFFGGAIKSKRVRTVRRIDTRQFTSFDGNKPRTKFKKGKR